MYSAKDPHRLYCLKSIEAQIKPACKSTLRDVRGSEEEFIEQCTVDYQKFCHEVVTGEGRVLKCLNEHSKDHDFECRKKVVLLPKSRK